MKQSRLDEMLVDESPEFKRVAKTYAMTVGQLKEFLNGLDANEPVFIRTYNKDGSYDEAILVDHYAPDQISLVAAKDEEEFDAYVTDRCRD